MKTKTTCIATILFSALALQSTAQNVEYQIIDNAPDKAKNLQIGLFFGGDFADEILGNGIQANFNWKRLDIEARYFRSFHNKITKDTTFPELILPHKLELTGAFHFYDRVAEGREQQLKIGGDYQSIRYIMVPVVVRKIRGIRGGIMDASTLETAHYKDTKGTSVNAEHNVHIERIFAGLFTKRISSYKIAAGERKRTKRSSIELFADVILAPAIKIDPVYKGAARDITEAATSPLGVRIGLQQLSAKVVGLTCRIETGTMPGAARRPSGVGSPQTFYTSFTVGLDFSCHVAQKNPDK
jgi:hypothetical protein